jgi:hypothetical protein
MSRTLQLALSLTLATVLLSVASNAGEQQWSPIKNSEPAYCALYPASWTVTPDREHNLVRFTPRGADNVDITLGWFLNRNHEGSDVKTKTLDEIVDDAVDAIKDSMVRSLNVTNTSSQLEGLPAMLTQLSYERDGQKWIEQQYRVLVPKPASVVELMLRAPAAQAGSAVPVFERVKGSLAVECTGASPHMAARQTLTAKPISF